MNRTSLVVKWAGKRISYAAWGTFLVWVALSTLLCACGKREQIVTVYANMDTGIAGPVFERFTEETGIQVLSVCQPVPPDHATLEAILFDEKGRPRFDVFWNRELLQTIRLKDKGRLTPVAPKHAALYPDAVRDNDGTWYGFAAGARGLVVNTDILLEEQWPQRLQDFTKRSMRGNTGMDDPRKGTTASYLACLFSLMGDADAQAYLQALKANQVVIQTGKKSCVEEVAAGRLSAGLTDSFEAFSKMGDGAPVAFVFADKHPKSFGALFMPGSVAMLKGASHPKAAKKLIDFLLDPATEQQLADGKAALFPLNTTYQGPHPHGPIPDHRMPVDFIKAAARFDDAQRWIQNEFVN